MSKPQGTDHALGAVRLANVIERTRTVSEAYAKLALLLDDTALEPRLERGASGDIRQTGRAE
jgi:hypothetical protein